MFLLHFERASADWLASSVQVALEVNYDSRRIKAIPASHRRLIHIPAAARCDHDPPGLRIREPTFVPCLLPDERKN